MQSGLRSATAACEGRVLVAMLTGMGQDGLAGAKTVVEAGGAATTCAGNGCVYALTVTGGTLKVPPAAGTGAVNSSGGTSGIIVDNDSASTGAASIYFTWRVNGTGAPYLCGGTALNGSVCAVKLTQSGLN